MLKYSTSFLKDNCTERAARCSVKIAATKADVTKVAEPDITRPVEYAVVSDGVRERDWYGA